MEEIAFNEKETRLLRYFRVGRLATQDGDEIHVVPICPVFDRERRVFYMGTHGKTRKVRNLRKRGKATLLLDQYSEDWMRHVGLMVRGSVDVIDDGPEFEAARRMLYAKYPQYEALFPMKQGESVVLKLRPTKKIAWDYAAGELNEPAHGAS